MFDLHDETVNTSWLDEAIEDMRDRAVAPTLAEA
jgi:hypothetical protein